MGVSGHTKACWEISEGHEGIKCQGTLFSELKLVKQIVFFLL